VPHSYTHSSDSSSAQVLKVAAVARRRDKHIAQSWIFSSVLVFSLGIVLAIYIKEVFAGFSPPWGFPGIKCCVPCDCVSLSDPAYAIIV
jgi:hypothetical protein